MRLGGWCEYEVGLTACRIRRLTLLSLLAVVVCRWTIEWDGDDRLLATLVAHPQHQQPFLAAQAAASHSLLPSLCC